MKTSRTISLNQIKLQERTIIYKTVYSNRAKYLRLQIINNELEVILPRRHKHDKVEDFILQKKNWILKHLKEKQSSTKHLLFGEEIGISINYDLFFNKSHINYLNKKLIASIPSGNNSFSQDEIYNIWLKHKAKTYIPIRVKVLSEKMGFNYKKIAIRSQKSRWGSCSTGGRLSFNYKLMMFRKEVIDYVIIHELCHLKEMNHSKKFWKLVERFCPDYKNIKRELRG